MVNFCCEYFYISFPFSAAVEAAGCFCCRVPVSRTTGKLHAPVRNSSLILSPGDRPGGVIIFALATGHWPLFRRGARIPPGVWPLPALPCGRGCCSESRRGRRTGSGVGGGQVGAGQASSRAGHAASGRGRAARRRLAPHGRPSMIYPCARGPGCARDKGRSLEHRDE